MLTAALTCAQHAHPSLLGGTVHVHPCAFWGSDSLAVRTLLHSAQSPQQAHRGVMERTSFKDCVRLICAVSSEDELTSNQDAALFGEKAGRWQPADTGMLCAYRYGRFW